MLIPRGFESNATYFSLYLGSESSHSRLLYLFPYAFNQARGSFLTIAIHITLIFVSQESYSTLTTFSNKYVKRPPPLLPKKIIGPSLGRGDLDARLDADGPHHINIFARTEAEDEADVSGKLTSSNA
jgi:hypothetical protein